MMTGTLPFTGDTPMAVAVARLTLDAEAPSARAPGLDPHWSDAILRCMARSDSERFARAPDVLGALLRARAKPPGASLRRWLSLPIGAAALAVAFGAYSRRSENAPGVSEP